MQHKISDLKIFYLCEIDLNQQICGQLVLVEWSSLECSEWNCAILGTSQFQFRYYDSILKQLFCLKKVFLFSMSFFVQEGERCDFFF